MRDYSQQIAENIGKLYFRYGDKWVKKNQTPLDIEMEDAAVLVVSNCPLVIDFSILLDKLKL